MRPRRYRNEDDGARVQYIKRGERYCNLWSIAGNVYCKYDLADGGDSARCCSAQIPQTIIAVNEAQSSFVD